MVSNNNRRAERITLRAPVMLIVLAATAIPMELQPLGHATLDFGIYAPTSWRTSWGMFLWGLCRRVRLRLRWGNERIQRILGMRREGALMLLTVSSIRAACLREARTCAAACNTIWRSQNPDQPFEAMLSDWIRASREGDEISQFTSQLIHGYLDPVLAAKGVLTSSRTR